MKIEYLNEIWKDIKGYEGLYQVSNFGKVKSLDRYIYDKRVGKRFVKGQLLTLQFNKVTGYVYVHIEKKLLSVHRLVAIAFIPNPNNYKYVNHKNEIKTDNRVENLEWCSFEYNCNYGTAINRLSKKQMNDKEKSTPVLQYDSQMNFIKEWPSLREIERIMGYSHSNISRCCRGKQKTAYGYIWKFKDTE